MSEMVIVNPLCKDERKEERKDEPEKDISFCYFTYLFCCVPFILGSTA